MGLGDLLAVGLPMLARWVFTVWGAWLGTLGLAATLTARQVWNPNPILPVGLPALMLAAGLGLMLVATGRLVRGPRRDRALAGLLLGTAPLWFFGGHVMLAILPGVNRRIPLGWPSMVLSPLARPFMDLEARWIYPVRTRGRRVEMVAPPAPDSRAQVAAMDRHVDALLARLHWPAAPPVVWYRGPLYGQGPHAIFNMAVGSEIGQFTPGADGLATLDRHEVAHAVLHGDFTIKTDPPSVLVEGWAMANEANSVADVAQVAWDQRRQGRDLSLRQLVAPDWYWYHGPAAYSQGGALVNHLLRVYGPERFLELLENCRQATFEADLRASLGVGLDELDAAYWADIERIVARDGPPARRWLKGLKLDPSIDPAAWDAFLADYFAAADRLVAPYDQVRMTTRFRIESGTEADRDNPYEYEARLTLLRSGPFARVRHRFNNFESAILAHPDHSLRAFREPILEVGPWTIEEDAQATPLQSYRRALDKVESASGNSVFVATHGGAALLQYPKLLKDDGVSPDFEVTRLSTSTDDGHPMLTLGLRSSSTAREADRHALTFVFAADDSFVVRSIHYELAEQKFVTDGRFEYDHQDGRPVLRSLVTTIPAQHRTIRLDVEACRFGPIPESEFALEPFLASLGPARPVRQPVGEPSTATRLDWYWLAFVVGGISLAGGSGLALGSRDRHRDSDRRALWPD